MVQDILKQLVHMVQCKISRVHQLQQQHYTQQAAVSQSCMDSISSGSGFSRQKFSDECVFHFPGFTNAQNPRGLGHRIPGGIQQHELGSGE